MPIQFLTRPSMVNRLLLLSVATLLLCFLSGCEEAEKEKSPELPKVMGTKARLEMVPLTATFGGSLTAKETVEVRSRVSGYVATKLFEEGAWVKAGTIIYTIDDRDLKATLASATALTAKAMAAADNANSIKDRMVALAAKGSISLQQRDTSVANADAANAAYMAAQSDEKQSAVNLSYAVIHAPTDGYMARSNVEVGSIVDAGGATPLTTVYKTDPIRAEFFVTDRNFFTSSEFDTTSDASQAQVVFTLALGDGRKQYSHTGVLEMTDPVIDPKTNTLGVRVQFPNPDYILKPGMYVNITATAGSKQRLLIPEIAVLDQNNTKLVYVVDENQILVPTHITVGQKWNENIIVETGLTEGQVVVVEGLVTARPGVKVDMVFKEPVSTEPVATAKPKETAAGKAATPEAAKPKETAGQIAGPGAAQPQDPTVENVAVENPAYEDGAGQIVVREETSPADEK